MKNLGIVLSFLTDPSRRRNVLTLLKLTSSFLATIVFFTIIFHYLMEMEGQKHSWATGFYWVLVVMSTLGLGDITFTSDAGRLFSVVVLVTGSSFMLVLLPFAFIQFVYVPWMESQAAARAPRELGAKVKNHVILTGIGSVEQTLVRMMRRAKIPYVLLVAELTEALKLHDEGYDVMVGAPDDPETYVHCRCREAALVVGLQRDTTNTNIAFTVREIAPDVPIVVSASFSASVDILELAGATQVLQLGEILGQALARRILGRDAQAHVVGQFDDLLIAEASVARTPLVDRQLKDIRLNAHAKVNVVGVWDRGKFALAGPETLIESSSILLLAGSRADLDEYNSLFCVYGSKDHGAIIIGGGRVGRAVAKELKAQDINFKIVEKNAERVRDPNDYVVGDAAEIDVLERAGIHNCSSIVITTHDDDINIYLAIYCRRLRPEVQILARANQDRNVSTLHRAGADFVMSYASTGASHLFNLLKRAELLLLADGLDMFRVEAPSWLVGRSLAQAQFRQRTGCNVVAVKTVAGQFLANPDPNRNLAETDQLIVVGDTEAEDRFFKSM
ncbi:MAG: NAD-binding protein [Pirellulaceae bacterium]|nr:NAD-binding protein [Pirellulaceae bacterium]